MKTLFVAAIALAGAFATPASAQDAYLQSKLVVHPEAAQPPIQRIGPHSTRASHDVYDTSGNYLGSDPDAIIRGQIRTDDRE